MSRAWARDGAIIPFHHQLLGHAAFRAGRVNTRFVHDVLGY
jgi:hypothetical protein